MRYTTTIVSVIILALSSHSASADASKQETIGVGSGAIVGALAGGPVGFVIGAAIGAKLGDNMHQKSERISTLEVSLQSSDQDTRVLRRDIDELHAALQQAHDSATPELVSLMQSGIDMDLLFRTDEFALTNATGERLAEMAATLARMPGVKIQLHGFADERGAADYNQLLSEKRVEFVRNLMITAGVHPTRISMAAHGESVAQKQDTDSYALERRVSLKLFIDGTESLASNPN